MALLREIYGSGVEKVKLDQRTFKTTSNKSIEIATLGKFKTDLRNFHGETLIYHVQFNPNSIYPKR